MKQNISLKGLFFAAMMLLGIVSVSAQNKLSIEPTNFVSHDVVKLQVNFEKTTAVAGMDFTVVLPDFLEFVGKSVERNETRFTSQSTISFNPKNGKVLIASFAETEIQGENGPLLYIPVKVKNGYDAEESGDIAVGNITFTTWNGKESWTQEAFTVAANYNPYVVEFAPAAETIAVNAGATTDLGVNIKADCNIIGFQAVVELPEGYSMGERAMLSDRCPGDANMTVRKDGNIYRLVYYTLSNSPMTGNDGLAFTLKVTAPADALAESTTFTMKDIVVSYAAGKSANANDFSVTMINGAKAFGNLNTRIDALDTQLAEALAEIAEKSADVKDKFPGTEISGAITTLRNEVAAAYAAGTLVADETDFNGRVDVISADIAKLITDAAAAQTAFVEAQRVAANNAAYEATTNEIALLQTALDAAKAEAGAQYPGTKPDAEVTAAQDAIDAAKAGAAAALEAVAAEGTYSYTVDKDGINTLIAAVTEAAKGQYDEAQRVAANEAAYKVSLDEIAALQSALDAAKMTVAQKYPGTDIEAEVAAAQTAIENAKAGAAAALEAVAAEGTYSYTVDKDGINTLIAAVTEAAKGQYDEAQRVAANEAAYKVSLDEIAALQSALDAAKMTVAQKYPGTDIEAEVAAAQTAIENAKAGAAAALEAVAASGTYSYTVDKTGINSLIAAIVPAAKTQYEEAQRVAANQTAYKATTDELAALQASLDAAKASAAQQYPGTDTAAEAAAAQDAIDAAKTAAENAFKAVATSGTYSYTVDKAGINSLIAAILPAAKAQYEEAQRVAANEAAYKVVTDKLAALQASLDATKKEVAEKYEGIDVTSEVAAAQNSINAAKAAADAIYKAVAAAGKFEYEVPAAEIESLINAVIAKAVASSEANRKEYNKTAYEKTLATIDALQKELDAAAEAAEKDCPHANIISALNKAQTAITNARTDASVAYTSVDKAGVYSYTVDEAAIRALIEALTKSAAEQEAAYVEVQRVAANKAAYDAVVAQIDALQASLNVAKAAAAAQYPDSNVDAEVKAAQDAIDAAKADAAKALEAVAAEGKFEYTVNKDCINTLIAAVTEAAKAQYDEAQRVAANKAAYDAVVAEIGALQTSLDAAKADVAAQYPDSNVDTEINAAQEAIDAAKADADKALEAVATEGSFEYTVDKDAVDTLIAAIVPAAKAQFDEAQRVAANDAAYQESLDQIAVLKDKLAAAKEKVAADYPDVDVTVPVTAAEEAINNAEANATTEHQKVAEEGVYDYTVPVAEIEDLIAEIAKYAEQNGIDSVYVEDIDANTRIFTLSGMQLARPQQGKVNILVGSDGSVRKVFVR